ncbi:hypothetical protein AAY473_003560, partial [Plecturocebus cupreus]
MGFHHVAQAGLELLSSSLALSSRMECSGMIRAHYSLNLLASSNPSASDFQSIGNISMSHCVQAFEPNLLAEHLYLLASKKTFAEIGFLHVGQAVLELRTSSDPPASASQSAGVISGFSPISAGVEPTDEDCVEMLMSFLGPLSLDAPEAA